MKEGLTQLGSDIDAFKNTLKEWKPKTRKLKAALKGTLKKLKKFSKKYEKAMKKYEKKGVEPDLDGLNSVMADLQMKYSKDRGLLQTMDLEGDVIGGTKKSPDVVAKVASKKEKKVEEK